MCLTCLKRYDEDMKADIKNLKEHFNKLTCECCISYYKVIIRVYMELKLLCNMKMKKYQVCSNCSEDYSSWELYCKTRIKTNLENILETVEEVKEKLSDCSYLSKMNSIKELNDLMKEIEEADHR